ncbi:hypothetical protein M885DRAFT_76578 [Pelagophyceae sp. CCMP2097]|nr:hypothetical protein M885DRAFT_76578 [Pelagophyceae sp. CCMP2097]
MATVTDRFKAAVSLCASVINESESSPKVSKSDLKATPASNSLDWSETRRSTTFAQSRPESATASQTPPTTWPWSCIARRKSRRLMPRHASRPRSSTASVAPSFKARRASNLESVMTTRAFDEATAESKAASRSEPKAPRRATRTPPSSGECGRHRRRCNAAATGSTVDLAPFESAAAIAETT